MRHVNIAATVWTSGPCSVGAIFCWDHWKKIEIFFLEKNFSKKKKKIENFLSLSLLRCGPDNNRPKEKRKTIKIKEKQNWKTKKNLENFSKSDFFSSKIFCLTFHLWASFHFVGQFVGHFYPPLRNRQTNKQTEKRRNGQTEKQKVVYT